MEGALSLLGKVPLSPIPSLLPQPFCSGLERQPHGAASHSVFSALGQERILLSNPKLPMGPQP